MSIEKMSVEFEYRAYWPNRKPQLGMCLVLAINWEDNEAVITNGIVRVYPKISEIILMRYTGFKDKAGRKIFFNDFLYDSVLDQKIYLPDFMNVSLINIEHWCETFSKKNLGKNLEHIEILGNINENSELINGISNWDILIKNE